jgi:hypothetical protein
MSHFIFTYHYHHHHPSPPQPTISTITATPLLKVPTSSCTHLVLHIHICSMLKEADDDFEMLMQTGPVKRSISPLHPPPPYNKHNTNYC